MPPSLETPRRIGDVLLERGYVTAEQLQEGLEHQARINKSRLIGEILIDMGYCTEEQVFECLATGYEVSYAKLEPRLQDPAVVELLPREYIEKNLVLPLFCVREVLTVAMSEPSNLFQIDELQRITGKEVQIVAATLKDIRRMINSLPDAKVFVIDDIIEESEQHEVTLIENVIEDIGDPEEVADQSPVIRLVNYLIYHAVKEGASDIHIEAAGTLYARALSCGRPVV